MSVTQFVRFNLNITNLSLNKEKKTNEFCFSFYLVSHIRVSKYFHDCLNRDGFWKSLFWPGVTR